MKILVCVLLLCWLVPWSGNARDNKQEYIAHPVSLRQWMSQYAQTRPIPDSLRIIPVSSLIKPAISQPDGQYFEVRFPAEAGSPAMIQLAVEGKDSIIRFICYRWDLPIAGKQRVRSVDTFPSQVQLHQADGMYQQIKLDIMLTWGRPISHDQKPQQSVSRLSGLSYHRTAYWSNDQQKGELTMWYDAKKAVIEFVCVWTQ